MSGSESFASEPHEGELYKVITVAGRSFTVRYGYYTELDRESAEAIPVFPDFNLTPLYTQEGRPFCTRVQDACRNYVSRNGKNADNWCGDCSYYPDMKDEIGVCRCEKRRLTKSHPAKNTNGGDAKQKEDIS